jgi:branched-chain amino acid transport system ATP-binding protein
VLELKSLSKQFGGLRAISDLSFVVHQGEFFGIIGSNGAGKTTLLNLITGYLSPTAGTIAFEGRRVDGLRPFQICRLGIGRTFQVVQPLAEMTVEDNVVAGALFSSGERISVAEARRRAQSPLEMVGLSARRAAPAGTLSLAEKKKLELARVLATRPRLLLLDEVMGGLPPADVRELVAVLRRIHQSGATIVMIEHQIRVILELAQTVFVLNFGTRLLQGAPNEVVSHPDVIEAYLGRPLDSNAASALNAPKTNS